MATAEPDFCLDADPLLTSPKADKTESGAADACVQDRQAVDDSYLDVTWCKHVQTHGQPKAFSSQPITATTASFALRICLELRSYQKVPANQRHRPPRLQRQGIFLAVKRQELLGGFDGFELFEF